VPAGKADANIVVQDVDAAPARLSVSHHGPDLALVCHISFKSRRRAAARCDHLDRLGRGRQIAIHAQHARALAREGDGGRAAIAHSLAWALAGADHDGDSVFQAHVVSLPLEWMPCRENSGTAPQNPMPSCAGLTRASIMRVRALIE